MTSTRNSPNPNQPTKADLADIAKRHLGIKTLEVRRSDRLDFHEVYVSCLEAALRAAFELGAKVPAQVDQEARS